MDIVLLDEQTLEAGGKRYRCAIGKAGLIAADEKREGDHKTPRGIYPLRACYYRPNRLQAPQTSLPIVPIRDTMGWCDDPTHARYNQLVRVPPPACGGRLGGGNTTAQFGAGDFSTRKRDILQKAKELRANTTDAEKLLWQLLRGKQLGVKFRRQHNVGSYITDFACIEKQLVVELDGGQHSEQEDYDAKREAYLNAAGFTVLRFWNNALFNNTEGVMQEIWERLHSPTPTLPRRRGRENTALSAPSAEGIKGGRRPALSPPFSYENLWRDDACYDLIVPIGYNDDPIVAGRGSAIFMHIAKPDYSGTEGCVALAREDMVQLLSSISTKSCIEM